MSRRRLQEKGARMSKPQPRTARIDVAIPQEAPDATVAIATCREPQGVGFRYQAVSPTRSWSGDAAAPSREAAILDAMTTIRKDLSAASRIRFVVSILATSPLWRYKDEFATLLPGASIDWPKIDEWNLMEAARFGLSAPAAKIAASSHLGRSTPSTGPLTVATDGSVRGGYTGIGWLACDGQYGLAGARHPARMSGAAVLVSELRAIGDAVRTLQGCPLTLASDSKTAIHIVRKWMAGDDDLPHGCNSFRASGEPADIVVARETVYADRDRLTLEWVRGHQGEPLNEGADALARLARRRAATPADLSADEYQRRAAELARTFACEYNMSAVTTGF